MLIDSGFSRYYGIHKKSGIRSHRMQDAAHHRQTPHSQHSKVIVERQISCGSMVITGPTTAIAACRLTIADQAIISLITRVDSLFDRNQFPVKFEQVGCVRSRRIASAAASLVLIDSGFSRYYGIHKKSGIRSHRMQDAAHHRQTPHSQHSKVIVERQISCGSMVITGPTTAIAACRLTIADQAIISLITRVDSLFDRNQFPVKFEQVGCVRSRRFVVPDFPPPYTRPRRMHVPRPAA